MYGTVFTTVPGLLGFFGVVFCLSMICHKIVKEEREMERRYRNLSRLRQTNIAQTDVQVKSTWRISRIFKVSRPDGRAPLTAGERLVMSRRREIFLQALLYVLVCVLITIWTYINGIFRLIGSKKKYPFSLVGAFYVFYPLGGALNILVYTRPKILLIRRRHPDYSWLRAFWLVMTAGGQLPVISDNEPRDHDSLNSLDDEADLNLLQFICCRKRKTRSSSASDLEQNGPNMVSFTSTAGLVERPASIGEISSLNNSTVNQISCYEKDDEDQDDDDKSTKVIKRLVSQKSSQVSYVSEEESREHSRSLQSRETRESSLSMNTEDYESERSLSTIQPVTVPHPEN